MAGRRDEREQYRGEQRDLERERRIERRADIYRGSDERGYGGGERLGRDWERGDIEGPERSDRGEGLRSADEEHFYRGGRGDEERLSRSWDDRGFREAPRDRGERRFRDTSRDVLQYADRDRERAEHRHHGMDRDDLRASPSGAFHEELSEERERPRRYGDRSRPSSLPYDTDRWSAGVYGLGAGDPGHGRDAGRYGGDVGHTGPERGHHGFGTRGFGEVAERERHHHGHPHHYSLAALHDLEDLSELRGHYQEHHPQRDYEPRYGHGPGVENMEPPLLGYGTRMTRRDNTDHELGHGGFIGDTYRAGAPHPTGRGPKGYQRSDGRIREDICDRLMMSWMNAENVDVLVRAGEVTLQGTVKSRDEKRAIEAIAESVLGVKDIINALRLERADQPRTEARPEQLPQTQNLKDRPQAQDRQEQERRAKDQEQTSAPQPGDTPLHS